MEKIYVKHDIGFKEFTIDLKRKIFLIHDNI